MPEPAIPAQLDLIGDFSAALTAGGYSNIRAVTWENSPDDMILILPGGGWVDMVASPDGSGSGDISRPRVDIQVRSADLRTAETRALSILSFLHRGVVGNCLAIYADAPYPHYWQDESGRHIFRIGFKVIRARGF